MVGWARMTNTQTAFGAEYDSLSDMVGFGVAPALIAYIWSLSNLGKLGWLAAFLYCAATALRLARFKHASPRSRQTVFSRIALSFRCGSHYWRGVDGLFQPMGWRYVVRGTFGRTNYRRCRVNGKFYPISQLQKI